MNKLLAAAPAILLTATTVLAESGTAGVSGPMPNTDTLLANYRLTEADLTRIERVHVTSNTVAGNNGSAINSKLDTEDLNAVDPTDPLFQWVDQKGETWSVFVDQDLDTKIIAPLIDANHLADDQEQMPGDETALGLTVAAIPEPASMAMLAVGLALSYPWRRKKTDRADP